MGTKKFVPIYRLYTRLAKPKKAEFTRRKRAFRGRAQRSNLRPAKTQKKSYRAESARLAKREKPEFTRVNEHFEGEHNAAIFVLPKLKKSYRAESARLAKPEKAEFTRRK